MAILTAGGLLQQVTSPTILGSGSLIRRVPFTFTSTARLVRSGKLGSTTNLYAAAQEKVSRKNQLLRIEEETRPISTTLRAAVDLGLSVIPVQAVTPVISMAVNPQSVKWEQNKRIVKKDTAEGSTFFHFTDSADQNNDILVCTFSGQTGNINTKVKFADAVATGANMKSKIWHELYHLSREGVLLNQSNTGVNMPKGIANDFYITYKSPLIQVPITLVGHFNSPLMFEESADSPFNVSYSFSFTVVDTSPSLDDLASKISSALVSGNIVSEATSLITGGTL